MYSYKIVLRNIFYLLTIYFIVLTGIQTQNATYTDTYPGEFPHLVSVQANRKHICAGSILNDQWVLTSVGCILSATSTGKISVLAGTNRLNGNGTRVGAKRLLTHGSYVSYIYHDIGLIQLSEKLTLNRFVKPVKLAKLETPPGTNLVLTGWGNSDENAVAHKITMRTLSWDECTSAFSDPNFPLGDVCAYNLVKEGACNVDFGGPLIEALTRRQVGILSTGTPCGKGYPNVFTKVFNYLNWIENNIK